MLRLIAALTALALAVPAAAEGKTLRGKTGQGRGVTLVLDAAGVPKRVSVRWNLACDVSKATGPTSTRFLRRFDQATVDVLDDADTASRRYRNGLRVRMRGSISARRAGATWSGTFSVERSFFRKGRKFDTCRAQDVTFSVS
jgi:hypothetical protein